MNLYQRMWDREGYGARWDRIMRVDAPAGRKHAALMRVWRRMVNRLS